MNNVLGQVTTDHETIISTYDRCTHYIDIYIYMNNVLGQVTTDHETIISTYVLNVESCN